MKLFAVIQYGEVHFYSNCELSADAYKSSMNGSKVVQLKMKSKLYKIAYKILELRKTTKFCLGPIHNLNSIEKLTVSKFLEYKHNLAIL